MLKANLEKVERVFPYVATCGHEMDEVTLPQEEFLAEFWWDAIKAAALDCATRHCTTISAPGSGSIRARR